MTRPLRHEYEDAWYHVFSREKDKCAEQYREDTKVRLTCGVEPTRTERLRDAVAIGSEQFAKRMRKVSDKVSLRGVADRRELRRRVRMEDVRKAVEELKGERWETFADRHGDWGLPLFLWGARRFCSVTLRELGAVAGGKADTAVGMAIRRFDLRSKRSGILRRRKQSLLEMLDVKP